MFAVKGYYNGSKIILDEDVDIEKGQEVIVTVLQTFKNGHKFCLERLCWYSAIFCSDVII